VHYGNDRGVRGKRAKCVGLLKVAQEGDLACIMPQVVFLDGRFRDEVADLMMGCVVG